MQLALGRTDLAREHGVAKSGYRLIINCNPDSGQEVFNFCEQEGIRNIAIMGVHTNMCILHRSFAIKQMTRTELTVSKNG